MIKGKYGWWLISTTPDWFILHLSGNKKKGIL